MSTKFEELQLNRELRKIITIPPTEQVHCYMVERLDPRGLPDEQDAMTDEQQKLFDLEIEDFDYLHDFSQAIADNSDCPPETSHVYTCDDCYEMLFFFVELEFWHQTEDGLRHQREQQQYIWHRIRENTGALNEPDFLKEGDTDYFLLGERVPIPNSHPEMRKHS